MTKTGFNKRESQESKLKLQGRVAIVTGAGSGIGRAGACLFGQEGAYVVIAEIREKAGKETEQIIGDAGGEALFVETDVSQSAQVQRLMKTVVDRYGRIDVLWNNAVAFHACSEHDAPVHELPESEWDFILGTTLKGVYLCSKYALLHMVTSKKGVIINTSSTDALIGQGGYDSYAAAKGGIVSMTRSMAVYYASYNIRVNTICPGFISTPATEAWLNRLGSRNVIESLHLTRVGLPEDIAKFALYLASDDAEYVTGGIFAIDGGFTAFKTKVASYAAEGQG